MNIQISDASAHSVTTRGLFVGLYENEKPSECGLGRLDATLGNRIEAAISAGDFSARFNRVLELYGGHQDGPRHIVVVGLGERERSTTESVRRAFGTLGKRARGASCNDVTVLPPLTGFDETAQRNNTIAALEGTALAMYRYVRRTHNVDRFPILESLNVVAGEDINDDVFHQAVEYASATINGVNFARDLVCMPAADLYPETYAQIALGMGNETISVEVLDHEKLVELKMRAILAVGQGSTHPPCVIHLSYEPKSVNDKTKTFALVGKGVTFDSGGLDIKTAAGMRDMKADMGGSATVMGVFRALNQVRPNCRVHGFVAAVENMTDGNAYHPGDIITAFNGRTIEIDNTDAEGRLALADVLAYAVKSVEPDAIVDLATLTGACVIALGHWCTGVMSNNDELVELLQAASDASGERIWRLPLWS
ncbi:MAG TPA: leucyl aminopeptidase, partial [Bacteroidetes bacterium]|nr:leucyl aminopeptidase [Bacteroidota bacterium]HEX05676.1 leucyl aminopeptidase [Bacteroidota bacterium]